MSIELGPTGQDIWEAYGAERLDAASRSLVRELARCADVLDRIHAVALGRREGWASIVFDDMGEVHLSIDKVLDEQRRSMIVFKTLHSELRQAGIKPGIGSGVNEDEEPEDMLAALRSRKEKRESQSG